MKSSSRRLAVCAMTAAVGVVLMLLGSFMGLGMYMAPIFVGWCLMPIGQKYGVRYQAILWIVIGLLSLLLVSDIEQNLMFIGFFGWLHSAAANGRWCGDQRPPCGLKTAG